MPTKQCKNCKEFKDISNFKSRKDSKDKLGYLCNECEKIKSRIYRKNNPEKCKGAVKRYSDKKENKDRRKIKDKIRRKENIEKDKKRIALWEKENPGKRISYVRRRQAAKLQRTPSWVTKNQLKEMQGLYILAQELQWLSEEPLEVDHIVPLQGENVSGLHVPWNLQILPRSLNRAKSNKS